MLNFIKNPHLSFRHKAYIRQTKPISKIGKEGFVKMVHSMSLSTRVLVQRCGRIKCNFFSLKFIFSTPGYRRDKLSV